MGYDTRHVLSPADGESLCRPDSWAANQNSACCKQCNGKLAKSVGDMQRAWVLLVQGAAAKAVSKVESALERLRAMEGAKALLRTKAACAGRRSAPAEDAAAKLRRLLDAAMEIADHWLPDLDPEDDNQTLVEHVTLFQEIRDEMRTLDQKGGS